MSACSQQIVQTSGTHQVEVVLDHVVFECLWWQSTISHLLHEFVMREIVPDRLHIIPV